MANLKIASDEILDKNGYIQNYPIGSIISTVLSTVPDGWLLCDGTVHNVSSYPDLGAHLGAIYGGNGTTTFAVPSFVVNATNNPNPRIPFSTISSESAVPSTYSHGHTLSNNATAFNSYNFAHYHNSTAHSSGGGYTDHAHYVSGNTNTSSNVGGSSGGRAAGPNGPYASGPGGGTGHSHGGAGWGAGTNAAGWNHSHTVNYHSSNLTHNHYHNASLPTSVSNSRSNSLTSSHYPLSKEVYFLIKY